MIITSGYEHLRQYLLKKTYFLCILPVLLCNALAVESTGEFGCNSQNINPLKSQACIPPEYSKFELPNSSGVNPIRVELLIQEVLSINDKENSVTFSSYFNMYWQDKRIRLSSDYGREVLHESQINDPNFNLTMNPNVCVPMNPKMLDDMWVPNALIYNLKSFEVKNVLDKSNMMWISADYTVLYSASVHITFFCPMNFHKFPLDTQVCKFKIGSYSYDDSQMTFTTLRAKFDGKSENSIPLDFAIKIRELTPKDSILIFEGAGNFSLAGFEMVLDRHVSTFIFTYYLPSALFVVVSWISFLIPVNAISGRMILLVTLIFVLINIYNTVTTNTPIAEVPTAIAVWMSACILFVFGAFIEYAIILFKDQRYVTRQHEMNNQIMNKGKLIYEAHEKDVKNESDEQLSEEYQWIDKFALIAFPIIFFVFNMFYWLAYLI